MSGEKPENRGVRRDTTTVLDVQQLRDMTLDDELLMREILDALIDDTSRQILLLGKAIREGNSQTTRHLAHYSKGACANVGANAAAAVLESIERTAATSDFAACRSSFEILQQEVERLRAEAQLAAALPLSPA
jgi:HPt (histidine-containing phosphotransfer) domain-containing protein